MLRIRLIGLAAIAAFALSAIGASAASAHEFIGSTTGNLTGNQVTGAEGEQVFEVLPGTAPVKCKKLKASGSSTALKKTEQLLLVEYGECLGPTGVGATVTPAADYDFNANGSVTLLNELTIAIGTLCKIKVHPQGPLEKITYKNEPAGKITAEVNVTGIDSLVEGGAGKCGAEGLHNNGTYKGSSEIALEEGTIEWL